MFLEHNLGQYGSSNVGFGVKLLEGVIVKKSLRKTLRLELGENYG